MYGFLVMETNWEDALMNRYVTRNRRAKTDTVIHDNRVFEIRTLEDGIGVSRQAFYYRRHLNGGIMFTGPRADGLALHVANAGR